MRIRPEHPGDHDDIHVLVAAAFGRDTEAALVRAIRASDHYVPDLALVATDGGDIVGHVMLSYVTLGPHRVLQLAPLSVRPDRQNTGIGAALSHDVLGRADAQGEPLVLVLGHPTYYPRFGFGPARAIGIEPPIAAITDETWMAKTLSSYDDRVRGTVVFPPAFDVA